MPSIGFSLSDTGEERASAPVEFTLVASLLTGLVLAVLQLMFLAHVRTIAVDSAIAGASRAALADGSELAGVTQTRRLLELGIASTLVRDVSVTTEEIRGRPVVSVTVRMGIPVMGPWLSAGEFSVVGRALGEVPRVSAGLP